jgi:hypothetical protein
MGVINIKAPFRSDAIQRQGQEPGGVQPVCDSPFQPARRS